MRLLRLMILIFATLSMASHPASAGMASQDHGASVVHASHTAAVHSSHRHAHASEQADAAQHAAEHHCPTTHHDRGCCDAACCGPACFSPIAAADGAFQRLFGHAPTPLPTQDRRLTGALLGLLDRPPISV